MKTKPEEVVVYIEATSTGPALVVDRGGMSPTRILLTDLKAKMLGAKFYIVAGNPTGSSHVTATPQTRPVFQP